MNKLYPDTLLSLKYLVLNANRIEGDFITTCSDNNTSFFPNLRYLSLSSNSISSIDKPELSLYSNTIKKLPDGAFNHFVNLTILRLDDNLLSEIRETTFSVRTRQRLRVLDLSGNPYTCTCSLRWFRSWLMDERQKFVNFPEGYTCASFSSSSSEQVGKAAVMADGLEDSKYDSNWSDVSNPQLQPILQRVQKLFYRPRQNHPVLTDSEKEKSSTSLLTAVLAAVLVVFMLTFLVLYKYRWHIRLALYEAFRVNPQRRRRQPEREYEYDVFVSYANEDVDWVRQELIPTLEGRHGLRLCIHQRDFPVGGNIIDNISTCVHASKRVLFVLSPHFARSRWCQFELVFCQNYVMERDDVLVLTLLAPISGRDMTDAISAMFKTTTYLAWGEEDDARKAFWGRLVLAFHDIVPRQVATGGFSNLQKLRRLNLSGLRLKEIDPLAFASDSLEFLYMSSSGIDFSSDSISAQMFDQCPKLSFLELDYNNFSNVTDAKVQQLFHRYVCALFSTSNSKQVGKKAVMADVSEGGKYSNKWSDFPKRKSQPISRHFQQVYHHQHHQPLVSTLTETSVSESQGQVFLSPVDTTVYLSDFFLSDQACLLSQSTSLLTAVLAAVLVVFMLTFLVLYKYRWHIRLALYEAVRGNPQRQQQRQPERDYEYDVFVSYANEDVDWVREELIPTLEGSLLIIRHGLRLCIHQRDFPVGGNIIDNISTCVHASKRVLFVLSPHFARSRWCQFELVFCQNYVMERDDVLVLTLLAPISGRDMTDAISAMFKTTTYLAWGEEDDARKAFWGRLVLAFHDIVPRQVA
ncbi:hypothetical protein C0Q70_04814 [Pomacea canaliculata]|uniref:TIR domain-containing protein n=1 Tax=Pomacea canaliculata TaxID=400727 RepID=A0A2T7PJJ2_POMCA|nr:hypothetical protein C0Q70_04814 [Pomacea canaliculata]